MDAVRNALPDPDSLYLRPPESFLLDGTIADQAQRDRVDRLRRTLGEHDVGAALTSTRDTSRTSRAVSPSGGGVEVR